MVQMIILYIISFIVLTVVIRLYKMFDVDYSFINTNKILSFIPIFNTVLAIFGLFVICIRSIFAFFCNDDFKVLKKISRFLWGD